VWLDRLDIAPGQRWPRTIEDALDRCPRMLVILSPASVSSRNVEDEVSFALEEGKTVIPLLYQECRIPFRLRPFQYADFRGDYDLALKGLLRTLPAEAALSQVVAAPREMAPLLHRPPARALRVYVSSTSEDLHTYRQVAQQVILARGWFPIMNEYWGAMANPVVETCCQKMKDADLVLLIMALRQGYVPTVEQGGNGVDSITALEIEYARKNKIPVLALLANQRTWPGSLYENEQFARDWVKQFRDKLNQPAEFFDFEPLNPNAKETDQLPQFRAKVHSVLLNFQQALVAMKEAEDPGGD
jgi:TIR domain/Domain of unknown function (DUF4062)